VTRAVLLMLATVLLAACSPAPNREDRMSPSPTTDQATTAEALRFGGIVAPPSAKVLGVQHDQGIDERYRVVMSVSPDDVATLLSGSGFTARPQPDSPPYQASVDGYDLSKATSVESAEDSLPPGDGRTRTIFRQVSIDHTDPANPVVHFWLFTT
jgi:hypothetical protein